MRFEAKYSKRCNWSTRRMQLIDNQLFEAAMTMSWLGSVSDAACQVSFLEDEQTGTSGWPLTRASFSPDHGPKSVSCSFFTEQFHGTRFLF